jgi:hypothetical protein
MTATLLPPATAWCRWCPAKLYRIPVTHTNEWGWQDAGGNRFGDDPDTAMLKPDPYAYLATLAAKLDKAHKAPKRSCTTWVYEAAIREYSALKVRLDFGHTIHLHLPDPRTVVEHGPRPDPVSHCDYPAWLRPTGWQCRRCRADLTPEGSLR